MNATTRDDPAAAGDIIERAEVTDREFLETVDRMLHLANKCAMRYPIARVSAALMFAAARYNAFQWTQRTLLLEQTPDEAALAFRDEYERMFRDQLASMAPPPGGS